MRGGAALAAGGAALAVWPRTTVSAPSAKQDAEILTFALTVEDLQAAFYVDAVKQGALSGEMLEFARTVGGHERAHAAHVRKLLGASAPKPKTFDFGDTNTTPTGFAAPRSSSRSSGWRPTTERPRASPPRRWPTPRGSCRSRRAMRRGSATSSARTPLRAPPTSPISASDAQAAIARTGFVK